MTLKSLLLLFAGALTLFTYGCGGSGASSDAAEEAEFSFAMSGLYKPFNYKKGGELMGFDVDIGLELSRRMGRKAVPVTNPWQTIIQGLKAAKYDAILGSMAITEKRAEQVAFSRPYYRSGAQIFVAADATGISEESDLAGKKIGVVKASTFKDVAEDLAGKDNVVGYDSDVIALQDLTTGRIDAVLTDRVVGFSAINQNDLPIKDVGVPLYVDSMGIAVRKDDAELLNEINAALEAMIADGTYAAISNKWFGRNILGEDDSATGDR